MCEVVQIKKGVYDFLGNPVVKKDLMLPLQGIWAQSLVRELRLHMPRGVAKNKKRRRQCLSDQQMEKSGWI